MTDEQHAELATSIRELSDSLEKHARLFEDVAARLPALDLLASVVMKSVSLETRAAIVTYFEAAEVCHEQRRSAEPELERQGPRRHTTVSVTSTLPRVALE